jgi:hypothetical protein
MNQFSATHPVTELAELPWLTSAAPIDSVSKVDLSGRNCQILLSM